LRFSNAEILNEPESVVDQIVRSLPSPFGRKGWG